MLPTLTSHLPLLLSLLLLIIVLPSSTRAAPPSTPVFRNGSTTMPLTQGWLGADASYTITLSPRRHLWLFDDTLSADTPTSNRSHCHFVHNTIGIMDCADNSLDACAITYYWSDADRQQGFWLTGHEADPEPQFFWVLDAFIERGVLYVFLQTTKNVPYGLNFAVVGSALVAVDNFDAEPPLWRKQYHVISNTNVSIPGQTAIARTGPGANPYPADPRGGAYLYSHMFVSSSAFRMTALMRFPLALLPNVSQALGHWQYFTTKRTFVPWISDPLLPPPDAAGYQSEIGTVRWHEREQEWINVAPSPRCFFGEGAVYSTSPNLTDGWTGYKALYQTPETDPHSARYLRDAWCYAEFEHPEFEREGELVFTYVCNGHAFNTVLQNDTIYEAQLVRMPYPSSNSSRAPERIAAPVQTVLLPRLRGVVD